MATRRRTEPRGDPFRRARKAEAEYGRQLRKVARQVGAIVGGFPAGDPAAETRIRAALNAYADLLRPWAEAVGERMLQDVSLRDQAAWAAYARQMGMAIRQEIESAPTGAALKHLLAQQVDLITSLPREAAERVHELALKGLEAGARPAEIAAEIMRTGEVTASRATLIARTETGRAATELTRVRAQHVGSTHFIWRTAEDTDVRPTHRRLNGKVFRWDDPPECDPGHRALPGAIWNCRCYAEPVVPDPE